MNCRGTYFSQHSLSGHPVEVELTTGGALVLRGDELEIWMDPGSFSVPPLLPGLPLFVRLADEEWLEIPATEPAAASFSRAQNTPTLYSRSVAALERSVMVTAAFTLLLVVAVGWGAYVTLPRLARRAAFAVSVKLENQVGQISLAPLASLVGRSNVTLHDRIRLNRELTRLAAVRTFHLQPRLLFVPFGQPNAFALPGGTIVATDELMSMRLTGDELAAVLAHELGHEEERHGIQRLLSSSLALLTVSAITGDLSTLTHFSGTLPVLLVNSGYSREFEREADAYAVGLLTDAGIDPEALSRALAKLQKAAGTGAPIAGGYFNTHPDTADREASILAQARLAKPPIRSSDQIDRLYYQEVGFAYAEHDAARYADEVDSWQSAFRIREGSGSEYYNAACSANLAKRTDLVRSWLPMASLKGWNRPEALRRDEDLQSLHGTDWWNLICGIVDQRAQMQAAKYDHRLQAALQKLYDEDQAAVKSSQAALKKSGRRSAEFAAAEKDARANYAAHLAVVQGILHEEGWVGPERVGTPAGYMMAETLYRADLAAKKTALAALEAEVKERKIQIYAVAYLTDQIAMAERGRQVFGTQVRRDPQNGRYYLPAVEEPGTVEIRRAQAGLAPLDFYLARWSIKWDPDLFESPGDSSNVGGSPILWAAYQPSR